MTPLYDIVSTQPSLDAKQIGQNQMKLAMAVGDNRHYVVHTITGRHFVQTAKSCGLPDKTVKDVVTALSDTGAKTIDHVLGALPKGFPEKMAASIAEGTMRRLKSLALNGGKD
jgi:serine/threonine-protein kinase HipA